MGVVVVEDGGEGGMALNGAVRPCCVSAYYLMMSSCKCVCVVLLFSRPCSWSLERTCFRQSGVSGKLEIPKITVARMIRLVHYLICFLPTQ